MTAEEMMERTDLSDLVRARMREKGQSLRELADACIDPLRTEDGPLWKRGTLDNLTKGRVVKAPTEAQLRALAAGADLPPQAVVRAAAAQFLGMTERWNERQDTRVLIARIEELDEEAVTDVDDLVEIYLRRRAPKSSGQG